MPRDLFEENNISLDAPKEEGRDLFAEEGIAAPQQKAPFDPVEAIYSFATGIPQGIADTATAIPNLIGHGINKLTGKNLFRPATINISENQITGPAKYPGYQLAGEIGGAVALPLPFMGALSKAASAAKLSTPLKALAGIEDAMLTGGAYGAGYEANKENPEFLDAAKRGATFAGLLRGGLEGATRAPGMVKEGAFSLLQKILPKTKLPEAEAAEIQRVTAGSPVDVGTALKIPFLRNAYKNWLPNIIGSGTKKNMQQVIEGLDTRLQKVMGELKGDITEPNLLSFLENKTLGKLRENENRVKNGFELIRKEVGGLDATELPEAAKIAQKYLEENAAEVKGNGAGFLRQEDENYLQNLLKKPTEKVSFLIRDNLRKNLSEQARKHAPDMNQRLRSIYSQLEGAIQDDLKTVLEKNGKEGLATQWQEFRDIFANEVVPYRELRAKKTLKTKPSLFADKLMTEEGSRVFDNLPQDAQDVALYLYLTKKLPINSNGTKISDPTKILNKYNALDRAQERLFNPKRAKELRELNMINDTAKEYRPILNKPQTGVQAADIMKSLSPLAASALPGGLGYAASDDKSPAGRLLNAAKWMAITGLSGKAATKFLTSPEAFNIARGKPAVKLTAKQKALKQKKESAAQKKNQSITSKLAQAATYYNAKKKD
jgi:hypothetical protein